MCIHVSKLRVSFIPSQIPIFDSLLKFRNESILSVALRLGVFALYLAYGVSWMDRSLLEKRPVFVGYACEIERFRKTKSPYISLVVAYWLLLPHTCYMYMYIPHASFQQQWLRQKKVQCIYIYVCMSVWVWIYDNMYIRMPVAIFYIYMSIHLYFHMSIYRFSICLSIAMYVCPYIYTSIHLCMCVRTSTHLFICIFVYLCIYISGDYEFLRTTNVYIFRILAWRCLMSL